MFRICGTKYREKHKNYEETWKLIATIVNLKKATKIESMYVLIGKRSIT
jgi:hypothetical protein